MVIVKLRDSTEILGPKKFWLKDLRMLREHCSIETMAEVGKAVGTTTKQWWMS